jgi:hypothetical protein
VGGCVGFGGACEEDVGCVGEFLQEVLSEVLEGGGGRGEVDSCWGYLRCTGRGVCEGLEEAGEVVP